MGIAEIEEAVKEVMGKDPTEMVIRYYEGLIQMSADVIAEEQRKIKDLQERIKELNPPSNPNPVQYKLKEKD